MGYAAAAAHIVDQVRALTPTTAPDITYVCDEDADGLVVPLEDSPGAHRRFDLRVRGWPADDGESGRTTRRLRALVELRIQYDLRTDRARAERIIAEDIGQVSLELPVIGMGAAATTAGIVSIPPPAPASGRLITDDGAELGIRVSIPFDLLYLET